MELACPWGLLPVHQEPETQGLIASIIAWNRGSAQLSFLSAAATSVSAGDEVHVVLAGEQPGSGLGRAAMTSIMVWGQGAVSR